MGTKESIRCDVCGRFVNYKDLIAGRAYRTLLTPDSEFTCEEYETLCGQCNLPEHRFCTEYLNDR